jgi:hypothetical protein
MLPNNSTVGDFIDLQRREAAQSRAEELERLGQHSADGLVERRRVNHEQVKDIHGKG